MAKECLMAQQAKPVEARPQPNGNSQVKGVASRFWQPVEPPCFAITGHHRSGTSLIASMLQTGGLDIGSRLFGPSEANKPGHFEDMDFLNFHVDALRAQG